MVEKKAEGNKRKRKRALMLRRSSRPATVPLLFHRGNLNYQANLTKKSRIKKLGERPPRKELDRFRAKPEWGTRREDENYGASLVRQIGSGRGARWESTGAWGDTDGKQA